MIKLTIDEWTAKTSLHHEKMSPMADAFVERRKQGQIHPVHDFLFTYYNLSPNKLKQWVPSFEQSLEVNRDTFSLYPWFNEQWFVVENNVLFINPERASQTVLGLAAFVKDLCINILERTPRFGCFGLHEWAMVYKASQEQLRYQHRPLRMDPDSLSRFVESQKLRCTHYDAFRFYTEEAKPLNVFKPSLETRLEMEQAGCVHANMDLYKWAIKLWPWVGSDFISQAFLLAVECRELDMRASPYDLLQDGFPPICIETEEGRREYQKKQQELTEKSIPLRRELMRLTNHHQKTFLAIMQKEDHQK